MAPDNEHIVAVNMPRHIGLLVGSSFDLLDLSGPLETFFLANDVAPDSYRFTIMSQRGGLTQAASGLPIMTEPLASGGFDTLIVVGGRSTIDAPSVDDVRYIRSASGSSRRIASVCVGAFTLAATGLLDGRVATTHWGSAARLQTLYPKIRVDGDRIFTSDRGIWTSAGVTAGIDMSLAMIEDDLGREAARTIARLLVMYHRRGGGQLQYSSLLEHDADTDRIRRVLSYIREHLDSTLSVEVLARVANLSVRQFGRSFSAATGTTAARAVERIRVEAARLRVEDGRETLETIARSVGFLDAGRMRQSFIRASGETPQSVRRLARDKKNGARHSSDKGDDAGFVNNTPRRQ
ncbi:GlxA family transcriptional regulator [Bradyrhizobium tropiciagri]|uniref:GlxA family transcriptional regulator n=1 Tax=Bradyrhizobium tropiciagri TaxID=312253 RepID=UPI0032DFDC1F